MRYSIEPRDRIYVKGYGFLSFAKNMGTHATKVAKHRSNKYSQKLLDTAKKSTANVIKITSKRVIQKTAETTDDLIGNKIADKITNISKNSARELQSQNNEANDEIEILKERYISPENRKQIIDELRLV